MLCRRRHGQRKATGGDWWGNCIAVISQPLDGNEANNLRNTLLDAFRETTVQRSVGVNMIQTRPFRLGLHLHDTDKQLKPTLVEVLCIFKCRERLVRDYGGDFEQH